MMFARRADDRQPFLAIDYDDIQTFVIAPGGNPNRRAPFMRVGVERRGRGGA